jgi:hypothetical protein
MEMAAVTVAVSCIKMSDSKGSLMVAPVSMGVARGRTSLERLLIVTAEMSVIDGGERGGGGGAEVSCSPMLLMLLMGGVVGGVERGDFCDFFLLDEP